MDAQSSGQHQHDGLFSWHPAMRPNSHDARQSDSRQTIRAFPVSTTCDRAADEVALPPQLAFQPRNGSPQHPVPPDPRITYSQNVDEAVPPSERSDGETVERHGTGTGVDGAEQSSGKAMKGGMDLADSTESLRTSEESAYPVTQEIGQETSSVIGDHVKEALGDKKEMDRVWELEEKEIPSNVVANLSRTNSFPVVPPLRQSKLVPPHSLPVSEVEEIIEGDKTAEASNDSLSNNLFPPVSADINAPQDTFQAIAEDENDDYFANSQSAQPQASTMIGEAEESRYDEGLPLIQSLQPQPPSLSEGEDNSVETKTPNILNENDIFNEFSSDSMEEISTFKPSPLGRKSTAQVLKSIHYAPHSAAHIEPQSVKDRPSLADGLKRDIAVSAQTAESQVLSEQQSDLSQSKPKDEDLAKMWEAALGDDDLLEEDENAVDPSAFFDDDGEGFLEGSQFQAEGYELDAAISTPALESVYKSNGEMRGLRETNSRPAVPQNKYLPATPSQPTSFQQTLQGKPSPSNIAPALTGFTDAVRQPWYGSQAPSRPSMPASTQSFADKSKGGYTSPYDLPIDVTRPKKRNTFQSTNPSTDVQQTSSRAPPPRSSSMFTGPVPSLKSQPPIPRLPNAYSSTPSGNAAPPPLKPSPSMGSFFEELKPSSRTRPSSSTGRFPPPVNQPTPPPPVSSQREILRQPSLPQSPAHKLPESLQPYRLLPPERMSLYGNGTEAEPAGQTVPAVNARYSPAPVEKHKAPSPNIRYAASPLAGHRPPPTQALPFQPRTSSPLAQGDTLALQHQRGSTSDPSLRRPQSSGGQGSSAQSAGTPSFHQPGHQTLHNIDRSAYKSESTREMAILAQSRQSLPPAQYGLGSDVASDMSYHATQSASDDSVSDRQALFQQSRDFSSYAPVTSSPGPLRRSQTSSPGAGKYLPEAASAQSYQRPASVNQHMSSLSAEAKLPFSDTAKSHAVSKDINYIKPTDGRELDPLERWKGSPIFSFGFGGAIVTSFPANVPRYAAGQAAPMIKCSPGEIRVQDGKILPLEDDIAAFPGPLKSKGKKKDVLDWLQRQISKMENSGGALASSVTLPDPKKSHEEKIVLWKVVQVLVENDGAIDSNLSAEKAIRSILSPELTQGGSALFPSETSNASLLGISHHSGSRAISDPASPDAMEGLRRLLLLGEREKAVWHAVDHRLWAHAMLLSSTLDKNIWRQVSQEFVRQEVKTFGDNTEALAALYQILAGNGDDSADELVPPSARAGLQMISKTASTGPTKNALDGLDRWRETLTLIVSNRSPDDGNALVKLGQLLASYGRTEAAHICYIFAKLPGLFGGPDDPQVGVALLGADHIRQPFDYGRDLDSILLSEVYDFSRTVLASSPNTTVSPHLQSFKLYHALILAEYGYKSEAQQYCEVITSTLNSTTKRSPYYHNLLLGALDNLVERLRQAPKDSSTSWISKPSIDKVSGSLWAKFNQYVAGEESDAASTGSGRGRDPAAGPFAGVTGDSPTLSRAPSSSDLYNSYAQGGNMHPSAPMTYSSVSRYAPASLYTQRSSFEQQGRPTQDIQRPAHADTLRPALPQQQYQSRPTSSTSSQQESHKPAPPSTHPVRTQSYLATPPSQPQYMREHPPEEHSSSLYQQESYQPSPPSETQVLEDLHQFQSGHEANSGHQPPSSACLPASFAYEAPSTHDYAPMSSSGYDPPSYNSEPPLTEESLLEEKPKKRSIMDDDDDDFEARAAALRREEKARKDREADEAFRRAAEADSQKDKAPKPNAKKSGWFGGWLGGKKEGEDAHGTPNAPIKAKLGEQSSFYYDAEKKRWIDKKNPDTTPAATATPPPPKGPPSRAVSASGPPPPSTTATPPVPPLPTSTATPPIIFSKPPTTNLPSSDAPSQHPSPSSSPAMNANNGQETASGLASGPPLAPPSRPATAMSGASSIDDLIGIPQARKGGTIKKAKKKGYVDIMAK